MSYNIYYVKLRSTSRLPFTLNANMLVYAVYMFDSPSIKHLNLINYFTVIRIKVITFDGA